MTNPLHQALVDAGFKESITLADGGLYQLTDYVDYTPAAKEIVLDGEFTVEQLQALGAWMQTTQLVEKINKQESTFQDHIRHKIGLMFEGTPPYTIEELSK